MERARMCSMTLAVLARKWDTTSRFIATFELRANLVTQKSAKDVIHTEQSRSRPSSIH